MTDETPQQPGAIVTPRKPRSTLQLASLLALTTVLVLIVACFVMQYRGTEAELMRRAGPGPTTILIYQGRLVLSWEPHMSYRPAWSGQTNHYGFRYNLYSDGSWNFWTPLWAVAAILAVIVAPVAALHWRSWQFSLRTLLIATTIIALALALTVWAFRPPN
jgi:hypothetical protein